jgi:hypothetical protein
MSMCARCHGESENPTAKWCTECERLYDGWSRRHASDIVWQALIGTVIVSAVGLGLPLLGVGKLVAAVGAFAGFGTIAGLSRLTRRRRRQQFLQAPLPRAYLPLPK